MSLELGNAGLLWSAQTISTRFLSTRTNDRPVPCNFYKIPNNSCCYIVTNCKIEMFNSAFRIFLENFSTLRNSANPRVPLYFFECAILGKGLSRIAYSKKYNGTLGLAEFRKVKKLSKKIRKAELDISFLKSCQMFNVFPNCKIF